MYSSPLQTLISGSLLPWRGPLVCLLLGLLAAHYVQVSSELVVSYKECRAEPSLCEEVDLNLALWTVRELPAADRYVIMKIGGPVEVQGSSAGLEPGDTVSLRGRWDEDAQRIIELERTEHPLRRWKERFSLLGALLTLLGLPLWLSWDRGGLKLG